MIVWLFIERAVVGQPGMMILNDTDFADYLQAVEPVGELGERE